MKLNQLTQDSKIQIEISSGRDHLLVDAKIAQVAQSGLVLYPVTFEGKVISFRGNHEMISLVWLQDDGKPLVWKGIAIDHAMINKRPFVLVRSNADSVEYNRRTTFRLSLDVRGAISGFGEVIVHDISNGGIGFYSESDKIAVGQKVKIGFSVRGDNYTASATVVRVLPDERRTLYGCTMASSPAIDTLIIEEQRLRLKGF